MIHPKEMQNLDRNSRLRPLSTSPAFRAPCYRLLSLRWYISESEAHRFRAYGHEALSQTNVQIAAEEPTAALGMNGKRPLSPDEQVKLLTSLKSQGRHRDFLFVLTGLRTGYRAQELLSIQLKHFVVAGRIGREISLPRRNMKFGRGQLAHTVSGRRVAIHPELRAALETYISQHFPAPYDPEAFLFPNPRTGRPISVVQAWRMFTSACHDVGIYERIGLHSTRKSFARACHDRTKDLVRTQGLLQHRSPLSTIRYLESALDDLDNIVCGLPCLPASVMLLPSVPSNTVAAA